MSTQAQIAEAQQRPWIEVAPAADQDLTFDESGHFEGKFKINGINIGTLPAVEARTAVVVLPGMGPAPYALKDSWLNRFNRRSPLPFEPPLLYRRQAQGAERHRRRIPAVSVPC